MKTAAEQKAERHERYLREKSHVSQYGKEYYRANRDKVRAWHAANYVTNREKILAKTSVYARSPTRVQARRFIRRDLRFEVMQLLGGKCACCGERNLEFLAVDHINGGGRAHVASIGGGAVLYAWLLRQDDVSAFRVLCHNCNMAIGHNGVCPHQYGPRLVGESDAG